MELIFWIVAGLLTLLGGILGNVVAHDICAATPRLCRQIIIRASNKLGKLEAARYREEWLSHLEHQEGVLSRLKHSLDCYLCANRMRRQAAEVILEITYVFPGIGGVRTQFSANAFNKVRPFLFGCKSKHRSIQVATNLVVVTYYLYRICISARRSLDPISFRLFANQFRNVFKTQYKVHIIVKDKPPIEITALAQQLIKEPEKTSAAIKKAFSPK